MSYILQPFEKYLPYDELAEHSPYPKTPWIRSKRTTKEIAQDLEAKKNARRPKYNRYEVLRRLGFRCVACGAGPKETTLHVDHIEPVSVSPKNQNDEDNWQVLCRECNTSKSNRFNDDLRLNVLEQRK